MLKFPFKKKKKYNHEIAPEEIFLDSSNLPEFNTHQFEGRIEKAISARNILYLGIFFLAVAVFFFGRIFYLQIVEGSTYAKRSESNHLNNSPIFADRGLITDRYGTVLAWNTPAADPNDFSRRAYTTLEGFNNLLGYVKYPAKDNKGIYYKYDITGQDGIEEYFNDLLAGQNGVNIVETDASGKPQSSSTIQPPQEGSKVVLSIDAKVQDIMFRNIKQTVDSAGFIAGAGVMMDVNTGEVIALTTYPEYDSQILTDGTNTPVITGYFNDSRNPLLDRAVSGLYTPGSIVKPFLAVGALNEGIIDSTKQLLSTGQISIPNPYHPGEATVFKDWKANGWTNIEQAIAVSSDVFFYEIGGGYQDQKGLGIDLIDKYISMFGFAAPFQNSFFSIKNNGVIPTPDWKKEVFNGDIWRLGDTYHTSIGQFGFQITPLQAVRAVATLANNGTMVQPSIIKQGEEGYVSTPVTKLQGISDDDFNISKAGMRLAVTDGTLGQLNFPTIHIAAKSGTAELGSQKQYVNSLVVGFFPYEKPRYAFALILEKGPSIYTEGAQAVMKRIFNEMASDTPEYVTQPSI